jgi:hypothetical protein
MEPCHNDSAADLKLECSSDIKFYYDNFTIIDAVLNLIGLSIVVFLGLLWNKGLKYKHAWHKSDYKVFIIISWLLIIFYALLGLSPWFLPNSRVEKFKEFKYTAKIVL